MGIDSRIEDGGGGQQKAKVTTYNQLVTAPADFSSAYAVVADTINTAFSFVPPVMAKQFVVTDILLYANKNVGANDASVDLYEATGADITTISRSVLCIEMLKQTSIVMTGLNLIIGEGKWLNIKTDDDTIFATIMGYYISVPETTRGD